MNLSSNPDLSLYQLTLDALAPSQPLKISPNTLKLLVRTLLDVLIEGKISAALWVKLPPTKNWLTELKRYKQQVGVSHKIYLCNGSDEDFQEFTDEVGQTANLKKESQILPIQLVASNQLEREYFLLVLSDWVSGFIVAYQPQTNKLSATQVEGQTQRLSVVFTFERDLVQRVFETIRDAIAIDDTISDELLECLEIQLPQLSNLDEKSLLNQLLVKQIQRTEKILNPRKKSSLPNSTASLNVPELVPQLDSPATTPASPNEWLRNKDELFKRVAQELRTPLANMKTALKLLDAAQLKPVQRQRYMQLLNTECDRQNSLISGLLELVQLDSEPQPTIMPSVQLADIVPGVVSTYQPLAQEKGIQLGYTLDAGLPSVSCLESWLRQILINLLHNSLKFTPAGGQVKVQVTVQGEYLQIAFDDTGIGIAVNEIPRIFDCFYRGRSASSEDTGAGLGLAIVQELLLRCGGSISATSKLGEGSNFKVLLPIAVLNDLKEKN
jgi:two-component system phosphate regulon sensor histidine kinase PhoR